MKALVLFGSPKRNSHTAKLTGAFLKGLSKSFDVEIVRLFELKPTPVTTAATARHQTVVPKRFGRIYESLF